MQKNNLNLIKDKKYSLHIDGAYYHTFNLAAGGGCLIDNENIIDSFVDLVPDNIGIGFNFHEYFALAFSLKNCLNLGLKKLDVQTDCIELVKDIEKLRSGLNISEKKLFVFKQLDILQLINQFDDFSINHVYRSKNAISDFLVADFLDNYIKNNNIVKSIDISQNKSKKLELNNNLNSDYNENYKALYSLSKKIKNNYLKNIENQIIIFLNLNKQTKKIEMKFLYYSKPDVNFLVKEYNAIHNSKNWGNHVALELAAFLKDLNIKDFRISPIGVFQNLIFDYIKPNNNLLKQEIFNKLNNSYKNYDTILFSPFTNFAIKVKENFKPKKIINKDVLIKKSDNRKFLFLTLKVLGDSEIVAQNFINENKNNELIKDLIHLPISEIQKNVFENMLNNLNTKNLSQYLKTKENIKKNGVNFKF